MTTTYFPPAPTVVPSHMDDNDREEGFTLIELLVVILIIGILAAIAIPAYLNQRKAAHDAALESDLVNAGTYVTTKMINGDHGGIEAGTYLENEPDYFVSDGSSVYVASIDNQKGVCLVGTNVLGERYTDGFTALYDSGAGGLNRNDRVACSSDYSIGGIDDSEGLVPPPNPALGENTDGLDSNTDGLGQNTGGDSQIPSDSSVGTGGGFDLTPQAPYDYTEIPSGGSNDSTDLSDPTNPGTGTDSGIVNDQNIRPTVTAYTTRAIDNGDGSGSYNLRVNVAFESRLVQDSSNGEGMQIHPISNLPMSDTGLGGDGLDGMDLTWFFDVPVSPSDDGKRVFKLTYVELDSGERFSHNVWFDTDELSLDWGTMRQDISLYSSDPADTLPHGVVAR